MHVHSCCVRLGQELYDRHSMSIDHPWRLLGRRPHHGYRGSRGTRTHILAVKSRLLCPLSFTSKVREGGFEPPTSSFQARQADQAALLPGVDRRDSHPHLQIHSLLLYS